MKLIFFIQLSLASFFSQDLYCLNYEEVTMLNSLCFGKELEVQEMPEKATACLATF